MDDNNLTPLGKFVSHASFLLIVCGIVAGFAGYPDLGWTLGGLGFMGMIFVSFIKSL